MQNDIHDIYIYIQKMIARKDEKHAFDSISLMLRKLLLVSCTSPSLIVGGCQLPNFQLFPSHLLLPPSHPPHTQFVTILKKSKSILPLKEQKHATLDSVAIPKAVKDPINSLVVDDLYNRRNM